ncbi:MAG TPA: threonine synthase [Gammaproteobacteria bacterium]|jgi:threonine synthase|nr:threonine synthase [Gammaproteobacteria bacterium]
MYFISTRDTQNKKNLTSAIQTGLASDGGLFVPDHLPTINLSQFNMDQTYPLFAETLLQPFFTDDALSQHLSALCENTFNFPIPLKSINDHTYLLELFHGPTFSFKDIGATFLANCFAAMNQQRTITIMVATSGDTGSAVASAFYQKPNVNVIILYPKGQISAYQERQITCWGKNVLALAVTGTFDHCQQIVKTAFSDSWWQQQMGISSANSINLGRLLPQMVYFARASMQLYQQTNLAPGIIVPTGNLGNATAAYWAQAIGFPIREIVLATNANHVIEDYLNTGVFTPQPSVATLANAMDVGNPSNFERLQYLFNTFSEFKKHVRAISVSDEQIRHTIQNIYQRYQTIVCPHTATGCFVREQLSQQPWIVAATADPAKFSDVIGPILQRDIPISPQMQRYLNQEPQCLEVTPSLTQVTEVAREYFTYKCMP